MPIPSTDKTIPPNRNCENHASITEALPAVFLLSISNANVVEVGTIIPFMKSNVKKEISTK
ncbi:MAG: hypothetical protein R2771_10020 [Saprospiraceae bacterium]